MPVAPDTARGSLMPWQKSWTLESWSRAARRAHAYHSSIRPSTARSIKSADDALKATPVRWGSTIREFDMCDYSLHTVESRPARTGDELTSHDFRTGTRGFAASEDENMAVCLRPGSELAFADDVECER